MPVFRDIVALCQISASQEAILEALPDWNQPADLDQTAQLKGAQRQQPPDPNNACRPGDPAETALANVPAQTAASPAAADESTCGNPDADRREEHARMGLKSPPTSPEDITKGVLSFGPRLTALPPESTVPSESAALPQTQAFGSPLRSLSVGFTQGVADLEAYLPGSPPIIALSEEQFDLQHQVRKARDEALAAESGASLQECTAADLHTSHNTGPAPQAIHAGDLAAAGACQVEMVKVADVPAGRLQQDMQQKELAQEAVACCLEVEALSHQRRADSGQTRRTAFPAFLSSPLGRIADMFSRKRHGAESTESGLNIHGMDMQPAFQMEGHLGTEGTLAQSCQPRVPLMISAMAAENAVHPGQNMSAEQAVQEQPMPSPMGCTMQETDLQERNQLDRQKVRAALQVVLDNVVEAAAANTLLHPPAHQAATACSVALASEERAALQKLAKLRNCKRATATGEALPVKPSKKMKAVSILLKHFFDR